VHFTHNTHQFNPLGAHRQSKYTTKNLPVRKTHGSGTITINDSLDLLAEFMEVGEEVSKVTSKVRCVLCCAVLCCAVLCCAVLCCAALCCAVLHCAVVQLVGPPPGVSTSP